MPSLTGDPSDADAARADLERLAAEVAARGYQARLVARTGVRPHLVIANPQAPVLTDRIYAEGEYFVWSWDQRVARRDDPADAADRVARVLRTLGTLGTRGDLTTELQVRSCEAGCPLGGTGYGIMGRVDRGTQDGVRTAAGEALPLLPQRLPRSERVAGPPARPLAGEGADSSRARPDLDVLRQVLAGLRRLV